MCRCPSAGPVGYYSSPNRGVNLCTSCGPEYTTLHPKSSSFSDCVCDAGYGSLDGTSRPCVANSLQHHTAAGYNLTQLHACFTAPPSKARQRKPTSTLSNVLQFYRCEACTSPYYQGILTDYLQPITGATKSNPYPACIYCTVSLAVDGNGKTRARLQCGC